MLIFLMYFHYHLTLLLKVNLLFYRHNLCAFFEYLHEDMLKDDLKFIATFLLASIYLDNYRLIKDGFLFNLNHVNVNQKLQQFLNS